MSSFSKAFARPLFILELVIFLFIGIITHSWFSIISEIKHDLHSASPSPEEVHTIAEITAAVNSFTSSSAPASSLAEVVALSIQQIKHPTFHNLQNKVSPLLFQTILEIPELCEVSYIDKTGVFFSYAHSHNNNSQIFTTYSSNASLSNCPPYFHSIVDPKSGNYSSPILKQNSCFSDFMDAFKNNKTWLGTGLSSGSGLLFFKTILVRGRGAICLGFPLKKLLDSLSFVHLHGHRFLLAAMDGTVVAEDVSSQPLLPPNTPYRMEKTMHFSFVVNLFGMEMMFKLVSEWRGGGDTVVRKYSRVTFLFTLMLGVAMVVKLLCFSICTVKASRREIQQRGVLKRQQEAAEKAERRSVSKSEAFAKANHDVKTCLAGVSGLIRLCISDASPTSTLHVNLTQAEAD